MARPLFIEIDSDRTVKNTTKGPMTSAWFRVMSGNGKTVTTSEVFEVHSKAKSDEAKIQAAIRTAIQQARKHARNLMPTPRILIERDGEWVEV